MGREGKKEEGRRTVIGAHFLLPSSSCLRVSIAHLPFLNYNQLLTFKPLRAGEDQVMMKKIFLLVLKPSNGGPFCIPFQSFLCANELLYQKMNERVYIFVKVNGAFKNAKAE